MSLAAAFQFSVALMGADQDPVHPNIVLIMADDLGYGDLGCYGAALISTPNIDRLAAEGLRLTNAYAPSSVCSPSRYSLLTGRYWWRNPFHPPTGVVRPGGPLVFQEPGVLTMPEMFRGKGYHTAAFGKWHLGFGSSTGHQGSYDWSQPEIKPGPLESGFEHFFGIAGNVENHPMLYIENHSFYGRGPDDEVVVEPLEETPWRSRVIPWSEEAYYKEDEVAGMTARKAVEYIQRAEAGKPIFLYVSSIIPHKPITPAAEFIGTSQCGVYGDFVQELDYHVGMLLDALQEAGRIDNTLILVTSDNGAVISTSEQHAERWNLQPMWEAYVAGHRSNGILRDGKHSVYEGGNRIPFIVRWPGVIPAGSESDELFVLTDVMATFAEVLQVELSGESGRDSISFLDHWRGETGIVAREHAVSRTHEAIYSIRQGNWKLIEGDPGNPTPRETENTDQLYNLADDPSETTNLWDEYPETVELLLNRLAKAMDAGIEEPGDRDVWDDDFTGTMNSNYNVGTAGAGAGVVLSNDQMVMDTGVVAGSARGQVHMDTDSSGEPVNFNWYENPVIVSFDIASIAGEHGAGRNVFFTSIGQDINDNYVGQANVMDYGFGLSIEHLNVGGVSRWRIVSASMVNAQLVAGDVVANISGMPTGITYVFDGTDVHITLSGATTTAIGGAGSGTVGGTDVTANLNDISEHITEYNLAFGAYNRGPVEERTVVILNSFIQEACIQ